MMLLLTNVIPVIGGYFMKLLAYNSQAKIEANKQTLELLAAKAGVLQQAREAERQETPMSAFNRRVFIFTVLALMVFVQTIPVFMDVPTVIPTVTKGFSFLGIQLTPDKVEYITVQGMLLIEETRIVFVMIAELWFGGQMAKGR